MVTAPKDVLAAARPRPERAETAPDTPPAILKPSDGQRDDGTSFAPFLRVKRQLHGQTPLHRAYDGGLPFRGLPNARALQTWVPRGEWGK